VWVYVISVKLNVSDQISFSLEKDSFQESSTMSQFCVNSVVAKIVKDYIQVPDYSALREEIGNHTYASLQLPEDKIPYWFVLLFVTSDCAIVQEVMLHCGCTRFRVKKIQLSDWEAVFKHWIDEEHGSYWACNREYQNGMRSFGASV
jgi:hypothetical protein